MKDEKKTKKQLIAELEELRCRLSGFEETQTGCMEVERALRDQLHFLQTLIDTIPNPIFFKDTSGHFLGCNKAFENRLGLSKEAIVGKTSYELFPKEYADKYREMDLASFRQPGEQVYETTLLYADGKVYDVIIYKGTFSNADGTLAGLVGVTVDITERKKAEEALRKAHDELETRVARRTKELARANEELRNEIGERKRAEEALRESSEKLKLFAYSVAHDLKSPTIGIYGLTKLLCKNYDCLLDEKAQNFCNQILRACENVVALVEKINTYAATNEAALVIESVNVKEILRIVRDEFAAKLSIREIDWSEPATAPELRADRLGLLRVFRNLVDNALKYGGDELSRIEIGYRETEQHHVFSVVDNGVGINREDAEKIFRLFHRDETARGVEGTGLGLAIVKEIAEQHHGRVWAEPGAEKGSAFHIAISKDLA
jgi:PAS domain S-box-containing protein